MFLSSVALTFDQLYWYSLGYALSQLGMHCLGAEENASRYLKKIVF
jgi:hypothetical protein